MRRYLLVFVVFLLLAGIGVGFAAGYRVYVVKKGDTLWEIAHKFNVNLRKLMKVNGLSSSTILRPGRRIKIPGTEVKVERKAAKVSNVKGVKTYTMKPGDTLWDIARKYGVSLRQLLKVNHVSNSRCLKPGKVIVLPLHVRAKNARHVPKAGRVTKKPIAKQKAVVYILKKGDTLWDVAMRYHVSVRQLMVVNNIVNPNRLRPGMRIRITSKGYTPKKVQYIRYRLRPGDNPWIIARRFHVSFSKLLALNHIKSPRTMQIGQLVLIPVSPGLRFSNGVIISRIHSKGYRTKMSGFLKKVSVLSRHVGVGKFIWPTSGKITSGFGWRRNPFRRYRWEFHPGIDIATYRGRPVVAADRGKVVYSGWMGGYGRVVIIDHGGGWITTYGHLHRIYVRKGQWVYRGQKIGSVGSTGRSTGPHLFFEVYYKGRALNPLKVLRYRYVSSKSNGDRG